MKYGSIEWAYADPFARALVENREFLVWLLGRTAFRPMAQEAVLMHNEMKLKRSPTSETWWRSHYTEKCRCEGCSGQETDLLAVFAAGSNRFALHIEVKQPKDSFPTTKDQASNYGFRAACWVRSPPKAVLRHTAAETMLLFSESRRVDYAAHIPKFGSSVTFEEIAKAFPRDGAGFATTSSVE